LGLEGNTNLRVVDVGNNKIEKIEGLQNAKGLEEFWVSLTFLLFFSPSHVHLAGPSPSAY